MKPYALTEVMSRRDLLILRVAELAVSVFPDRDKQGELLRCHEVARAVARVISNTLSFHVHIVDGTFDAVEHSWLSWRGKTGEARILDVYAVGTLPPVQIHHLGMGLRRRDYKPQHIPRDDVRTPVIAQLVMAWEKYVEENKGVMDDITNRVVAELAP